MQLLYIYLLRSHTLAFDYYPLCELELEIGTSVLLKLLTYQLLLRMHIAVNACTWSGLY